MSGLGADCDTQRLQQKNSFVFMSVQWHTAKAKRQNLGFMYVGVCVWRVARGGWVCMCLRLCVSGYLCVYVDVCLVWMYL